VEEAVCQRGGSAREAHYLMHHQRLTLAESLLTLAPDRQPVRRLSASATHRQFEEAV
jgi:hypothetical protein